MMALGGGGRWRPRKFRTRDRTESCQLHGSAHFWIAHESIPDKLSASVVSHEHANAKVNANNVRASPAGQRIEGIHKTLALPDLLSVIGTQVSQRIEGVRAQEGQ